jgi:hypothetical protein
MENNHRGNIVLFLYPTPKSLREPSFLYKNAGCDIWTIPNTIKKIIMAAKVVLFLVNVLNIYIIITIF